MSSSQTSDSSKGFNILIASDIHLGYCEKDVLRGDDSFVAFEEVLQLARSHEVDFLLLGGDLFHENKPSAKSMKKCVELLRKYCLGTRDDPIQMNIVSDQQVNFNHSAFPRVNYEDENLKVCLPVFSIHGNHDDPVGKDPVCVLDTLSAMGLVNFFGKYVNIEQISIEPLLLEKENAKIALYGLGAIPEERLHRMFLQDKVEFIEPKGENIERWLRIFVVHQNRVAHGTKYLPEKFLGELPNLVIWGHEHESIPDLQQNPETGFHVFQPGSTVATSLCPAEAEPKHVGLLTVNYDPESDMNIFNLAPLPLKTVRRMIFQDINIDSLLQNRGNRDEKELNNLVFEHICDRIQEFVNKAAVEHSGDPKEPKEPLIRVRAEYSSDYRHINPGLFNHRFLGIVANPKEIVMFKNKRTMRKRNDTGGTGDAGFNSGELDELMDFNAVPRCNIDDVIFEYFQNTDEKNKLTLLSEKVMVQAIKEVVEKEQSTDRLTQAIDFFRNKIHDSLVADNQVFSESKPEIESAIKKAKEKYMQDESQAMKELKTLFLNTNGNSAEVIVDSSDDEIHVIDDDSTSQSASVATTSRGGKGRGRGRGARGATSTRGGNRGRGKDMSLMQSSLDNVVKYTRRS